MTAVLLETSLVAQDCVEDCAISAQLCCVRCSKATQAWSLEHVSLADAEGSYVTFLHLKQQQATQALLVNCLSMYSRPNRLLQPDWILRQY